MLAVRLKSGTVSVVQGARPQRPDGFALIRLLYGGICNTDLELQRGYYNFSGTPGHEFVGEVVEADDRAWIGQRVVGDINLACGKCEWCRRDLGRHCPRRTVLGILKHPGAFRELLTLPERNLHRVPREVSSEQAVFVEPLAAACEILDQVRIPRGAAVAVLGDGKLGLLIGQVLKAHGTEVHQYGRHKEKLRIAAAMGVDTQAVRKGKLPSAEYDWVVDATGSAQGLQQAARMARPRGTVIMKSTVHGLTEIDSASVIVNEITLVGSRCGRFEPALRLLRSGKVKVEGLISEMLPLKDARAAFRRAGTAGVLKVLLHA
jgi:alcohol dehydrogenase